MRELIRFNWQAFDAASGTKVAVGLIVMLALTYVTGETWMATGLVAMLVWLTNVPGPLKDRLAGMLAFAAAAIGFTVVSGWMGLALWPNVVAIAVVGLLGTLALASGTRAFMVGWTVICWAIYAPFLIDGTSVLNCVLAIVAGTGILMVLNAIAAMIEGSGTTAAAEASSEVPGIDFVIAFSVTIAFILAATTYLGWAYLTTDATIVVGAAFFIIGFDVNTTWIMGIARIVGVAAGTALGLLIGSLLGPGLIAEIVMVAACFMSFAAMAVHAGAFMFFFMILLGIAWHGLEPERLNLTFWERLSGETVGVLVAMSAILLMQYWRDRRLRQAD